MIETVPVNERSVLAYRVRGRVTAEEYREFASELERRLRSARTGSLLIELDEFEGVDPAVAWDDSRFGIRHEWDLKRIAVVGTGQLQHAVIAVANTLSHADIRFFERAEEAWSWVEESDTGSSAIVVPDPYRSLLLATDFSPCSERAAARAREIADRCAAELHVLHVVREAASDLAWYVPPEAQVTSAEEPMMRRAADSLTRFAARTGLEGRAALHLESGQPAWSIVSWAASHDMDLIVLGSHGRHGIRRMLGSVSTGVVGRASCEVLVVNG